MTYDRMAWEVRCCKDLIYGLEELLECYVDAPESWHTDTDCAICRGQKMAQTMLEDMRDTLRQLEQAAVDPRLPLIASRAIH